MIDRINLSMTSSIIRAITTRRVGEVATAILFLGASLLFLSIIITNTFPIDFDIYYRAGQAVFRGQTPYQLYGKFQLPFQYFPWAAWFFAPFSTLPFKLAWYIFATLNTIVLFLSSITFYTKTLPVNMQEKPSKLIILFSSTLIMSMLTFQTGQISILIAFICIVTIVLIKSDLPYQAGLLFPLLILKPHLVLIFIPCVLWIGGKKYILSAVLATAVVAILAFIIHPNWASELAHIILVGQDRDDNLLWGFATLAGALELKNWRIYNFYIAIPSLLIAIVALRNFKVKSKLLFLSLALSLSLFSAPYSFAYDLPLLLPAIILLSQQKWYYLFVILLSTAIPLIFLYQGQSYILTVSIAALFFFKFHNYESTVEHAN